MPEQPKPPLTAEEREEREDAEREAYLLWMAALMEGVEDFEADINGDFDDYMDRVDAAAEKTRNRIERTLRGGLEFEDGALDPAASALLSTRAKVDSHLWDWKDAAIAGLGIVSAGDSVRGATKVVDVFNRAYRVDIGGPARMVARASGASLATVKTAASSALKTEALGWTRKQIDAAIGEAQEFARIMKPGQAASLADNPIRAIEQKVHQVSMSAVDATSGPIGEAAIAEVGRKFAAPSNVLKASVLTHQRAAFRAPLASFAQSLNRIEEARGGAGVAAASIAYLYYLPSRDRRKAKPEGFGAKHYGQIRTERDWRGVMRALDHKRPGSFMFSTGFHVLDPGYLLPVPAALLVAAREVERRRRQRFLESLEADDAE